MNAEKKQLAWDIMTNFVESRYSSWFMNLDYKRKDVEADELDIVSLEFEEFDEDTMTPVEPRRVFQIDQAKVIKAMRTITMTDFRINDELKRRIYEALSEEDYLDLDAETDDCIIQVAAFGELVYG